MTMFSTPHYILQLVNGPLGSHLLEAFIQNGVNIFQCNTSLHVISLQTAWRAPHAAKRHAFQWPLSWDFPGSFYRLVAHLVLLGTTTLALLLLNFGSLGQVLKNPITHHAIHNTKMHIQSS